MNFVPTDICWKTVPTLERSTSWYFLPAAERMSSKASESSTPEKSKLWSCRRAKSPQEGTLLLSAVSPGTPRLTGSFHIWQQRLIQHQNWKVVPFVEDSSVDKVVFVYVSFSKVLSEWVKMKYVLSHPTHPQFRTFFLKKRFFCTPSLNVWTLMPSKWKDSFKKS